MFGTRTIEYFSLSEATDTTFALCVSQGSQTLDKGIAVIYCKTEHGALSFLSALNGLMRPQYTLSIADRLALLSPPK